GKHAIDHAQSPCFNCVTSHVELRVAMSEFVERTETFDAIEFLCFPIDGAFKDSEAVARRCEQKLLRAWVQIARGAAALFFPDTVSEHPVHDTLSPLDIKQFIVEPSAAFGIAFAKRNELTATAEAIVNRRDASGVGVFFVLFTGAQTDTLCFRHSQLLRTRCV